MGFGPVPQALGHASFQTEESFQEFHSPAPSQLGEPPCLAWLMLVSNANPLVQIFNTFLFCPLVTVLISLNVSQPLRHIGIIWRCFRKQKFRCMGPLLENWFLWPQVEPSHQHSFMGTQG